MKRVLWLIFILFLIPIPVHASQLLTNPKFLTLDDSGVPMQGCVYTYEPGGTTKKTTYSDKLLSNCSPTCANTNPIQCDSRGECGLIYFEGLLKIVVTNPTPGTLTCPTNTPALVEYTLDNLEGSGSSILDFQTCSDYSSLQAAVTAIGDTETTLFVDCDLTLTGNLIIPATLNLEFIRGNVITLGDYNLTFAAGHPVEDRPSFQIFNQAGTGKVSGLEIVRPELWGTGSTAFSCAISSGSRQINISGSTYSLGTSVIVDHALIIQGVGLGKSILQLTDTTMDFLDVQSDSPFVMRDLTIESVTDQTAGSAVKLRGSNPGSSVNYNSVFENVEFRHLWRSIYIIDAYILTIDKCRFIAVQETGVLVDSVVNGDGGDNVITNCNFGGSDVSGSVGIRQYAGSGLRIKNNKFYGYPYAYHMQLKERGDMGLLFIHGNSFEPNTGGAILLETVGTTQTWGMVSIVGNTFRDTTYSILCGAGTPVAWTSDWLITSNIFVLGTTGTGIALQSGFNSLIDDNLFWGGGGACTGIQISGGVTGTNIGNGNHFPDVITPIDLAVAVTLSSWKEFIETNAKLTGFALVDPPSLNDGQVSVADIVVTGAEIGDNVMATVSNLTGGWIVSGSVTSTNTVTIVIYNKTSGAVDLGEGTWRADVWVH